MHKKHPNKPHHPPTKFQNPKPAGPAPHDSPRPTHWAHVADWYDQLVGDDGSEYHQQVILPGILRLLDIKDNRTASPLHILDLACGQGVLCRKLAALAGAGCTVTGLDAAPPLLDAAKKRNALDHLPIHYHLADATKLLGGGPPNPHARGGGPGGRTQDFAITPNAFDAVTCILAIQNMTPLSPIWQAVHTALKPKGSLILVMMHPCFRIPQHSDWHWDPYIPTPSTPAPAPTRPNPSHYGRQGRIIYNYLTSLKIQIQTHPSQQSPFNRRSKIDAPPSQIENRPTTTPHFHRPLQAYINTLGNSGLLLDHLEEWPSHKSSQPGPKKAALDHSRNEIPMFLALRARKV